MKKIIVLFLIVFILGCGEKNVSYNKDIKNEITTSEVSDSIKVINISEDIYLLMFENQYELASTFLRFQEYYESPEFKGKIFTLDEYKKWYSKINGQFTYYSDWDGFNIPSYVLEPFYEEKFDPLSQKEKDLLSLFKNNNNKFYIIATHKNTNSRSNTLNHEISHGLFYTDDQYKKSALKILSNFDTTKIKSELILTGGYHEDVLDDEVHAFATNNPQALNSNIPNELHKQLLKNYEDALKKHNIKVSDMSLIKK